MSGPDWERVHAAEWAGRPLNLNPGALGTPSRRALRALRAFRDRTDGAPIRAYREGRSALRRAREALAALHPHPALALGAGTSAQMVPLVPALVGALATPGRPLRLLTTTHEHVGALGGWRRHPGVHVRELDPDALVAALQRDGADLVLVSQVTWTESARLDVDAVLAAAGDALVLVDAAQAAGLTAVPTVGDVGVASLHKWMAGPWGTGFGWLSARALARLDGRLGDGDPLDPGHPAAALEPPGGQDLARWAGLAAALELYQELGPAAAEARARDLAGRFAAGIAEAALARGARFRGAEGWVARAAVAPGGAVVLRFPPGLDPYPVYERLTAQRVYSKCLKSPVAHQLRFGLHWGEHERRVDRAAARVRAALAAAGPPC